MIQNTILFQLKKINIFTFYFFKPYFYRISKSLINKMLIPSMAHI